MSHDTESQAILEQVVKAYKNLGNPISLNPIVIGQINKTYVVKTAQGQYILQELSPIFSTAVMDDAWAVCAHLQQKNIKTPHILKTDQGDFYLVKDNRIFRALAFISGHSYKAIDSPAMAYSAGKTLAKFHYALIDFTYDYQSKRRHAGDYEFHMNNLIDALARHKNHDYWHHIDALAQKLIPDMSALISSLTTTPRHIHGDPKISNLLFDDNQEAICLVDFDTLGPHGWSWEVADALRSWCNPYPEDVLLAYADVTIAEQALRGYGEVIRPHFSAGERQELIDHCQAISLCLTMRYAADTLNENYFLYDHNRFSRHADHSWLKTQSMHNLYRDFVKKIPLLTTMIDDCLA